MPVSTRKRLDGNLPEFLERCQQIGIWEAILEYKLPDTGSTYVAVRKIGIKETRNENFGVTATANSYATQGIEGRIREFIAGFAEYVIEHDRREEVMQRRLDVYELDHKKTERQFAGNLMASTQMFRSTIEL